MVEYGQLAIMLGVILGAVIYGIMHIANKKRQGSIVILTLESSKVGGLDSKHHRMRSFDKRLTPEGIFIYIEDQINRLAEKGSNAIVTNVQYFE